MRLADRALEAADAQFEANARRRAEMRMATRHTATAKLILRFGISPEQVHWNVDGSPSGTVDGFTFRGRQTEHGGDVIIEWAARGSRWIELDNLAELGEALADGDIAAVSVMPVLGRPNGDLDDELLGVLVDSDVVPRAES